MRLNIHKPTKTGKQWKHAEGHLALIYVLGKKFPANEIINI
jgi:hypothetical protein